MFFFASPEATRKKAHAKSNLKLNEQSCIFSEGDDEFSGGNSDTSVAETPNDRQTSTRVTRAAAVESGPPVVLRIQYVHVEPRFAPRLGCASSSLRLGSGPHARRRRNRRAAIDHPFPPWLPPLGSQLARPLSAARASPRPSSPRLSPFLRHSRHQPPRSAREAALGAPTPSKIKRRRQPRDCRDRRRRRAVPRVAAPRSRRN